jgi:hypothetical protein
MIEITVGESGSGFWSPQIIAAVISGCIAVLTGGIVGFFAWRQWRTAQDKLALELFDRRFKLWSEFEVAFVDTLTEARRDYCAKRSISLGEPMIRRLTNIEADSRWLFGPEVVGAMAEVSAALLAIVGFRALEGDAAKPSDAFRHSIAPKAFQAMNILRARIEPYMMMGDIAVNRPARRRGSVRAKTTG